MNNFSPRTDLAIETTEMLGQGNSPIDGVEIKVYKENDDITMTWVEITNKKGEEQMGRPIGSYVTIESNAMKENATDIHEDIIKVMSSALSKLCNLKENSSVLVAGLGNRFITPDALGPQVINRILVTRHLKNTVPKEIENSVRSVSAISPGVMGITGIETGEILKGIAEKVKPDLIIAIDALAARRFSRINTTIQMANTGVAPGAGIGNKRLILDEKFLGVPIIAIGVPTVVDAATLVNDTMDFILDSMVEKASTGNQFYSTLKKLDRNEKYNIISELLNPYEDNMFVTPKEVDAVINRLAYIISNSINIALHPGINTNDINKYIS